MEALLRSENEVVICYILTEITEVLPSLPEREQNLLVPIICSVTHIIKQQKSSFELGNLKTLITMSRAVSQLSISGNYGLKMSWVKYIIHVHISFVIDLLVSETFVPSLLQLLDIVTTQDPKLVPDIQQIISEVQESKPFQTGNPEEDLGESDKLSTPGKVKDRVNKLFQKQGTMPFWKK